MKLDNIAKELSVELNNIVANTEWYPYYKRIPKIKKHKNKTKYNNKVVNSIKSEIIKEYERDKLDNKINELVGLPSISEIHPDNVVFDFTKTTITKHIIIDYLKYDGSEDSCIAIQTEFRKYGFCANHSTDINNNHSIIVVIDKIENYQSTSVFAFFKNKKNNITFK